MPQAIANLIKLLLSLFVKNPLRTGALEDPRYDDEKERDYVHEERHVATATNPFSNAQILQSPYFYENQNRTFSCVAHGVGLALAIERKVDFGEYIRISQMFGYRLRSNYPEEGAFLQGMFDIFRNQGTCLYTTLATPFSEAEANAIQLSQQQVIEAKMYKGLNYFTVANFKSIDTLANIAAKNHAVAILIFANQDEWGLEYPEIQDPTLQLSPYNEIRHCVCVLPNSGFTRNGEKYITVQDSAWFGGKQLRHLSEDWVRKRVYGAAYWDTVAPITPHAPRPLYKFTQILRYGDRNNEVNWMQKFLISEGLLPPDCSTGYFGGITLAAVKAFQSKYASEILAPVGLDKPTGIWGNNSITKANQLCS